MIYKAPKSQKESGRITISLAISLKLLQSCISSSLRVDTTWQCSDVPCSQSKLFGRRTTMTDDVTPISYDVTYYADVTGYCVPVHCSLL